MQAPPASRSPREPEAQREHQSDIHVDSRGDQGFYGLNTLARRNYLNHQVGPVYGSPEPLSFSNRFLGIAGELRRRLDAHKAIGSRALLVSRPQHIGGAADILY
jgi:hypothetical protein